MALGGIEPRLGGGRWRWWYLRGYAQDGRSVEAIWVSRTIVDVSSLFRRTSFLSVAVALWTGDDLIATRLQFFVLIVLDVI